HDLEKSTGVNVWTYAQNLAGGWFGGGGEWVHLRGLIDILGMSARGVVDDIRTQDAQLGFLLDVAISRALVVAELALGGMLAERLRKVDAALIPLHASVQDTADDSSATGAPESSTNPKFIDQETIPFLRPDRPVSGSGVSEELMTAISRTLTIARG